MSDHNDHDAIWKRQTLPAEGKPYGWIQWKGTRVCMDVFCECGQSSHVDDEFVYYVRCPHCKRVYMVNGHVEFVPLLPGEVPHMDPREGD